MKRNTVFTNLVVLSLSSVACDFIADFEKDQSSTAGADSGGKSNRGGAASNGGSAGKASSGGTTASTAGGTTSTASTSSGGIAGTDTTATTTSSGGTAGTGTQTTTTTAQGGTSLGGATSGGTTSGGTTSGGTTTTGVGGVASPGGATNGGATVKGGTSSVGGTTATGGAAGKGGTVSTGGVTSTGGVVATGGVATGGVATGGVATGGVATGGVATGGVATGGVATGGVATGGVATGGASTVFPSCKNLTTQCQSESCCTAITVPGGTFPMGRSTSGSDSYSGDFAFEHELPEHNATVASFSLDKYEVTVGRFRQFVLGYAEWIGAGNPQTGGGRHPLISSTGWGESWTVSSGNLPASEIDLRTQVTCNGSGQNWSDSAATLEASPMNCLSWYVAFAFCLWDGGRLPTEAEWEYVAAGGGDTLGNRLYPWGGTLPTANLAVHTIGTTTWGDYKTPVGSKPLGKGRWNHLDLAGSMMEWTVDWYSATYYGSPGAPVSCTNCANVTAGSSRTMRGGSWVTGPGALRATYRNESTLYGKYDSGVRCARPAQ